MRKEKRRELMKMPMRLFCVCLAVLLMLSGCYLDPNVLSGTEFSAEATQSTLSEEVTTASSETQAEATADPNAIPNVPDDDYTKIY